MKNIKLIGDEGNQVGSEGNDRDLVVQESQFRAATGVIDESVGLRILTLCAGASGLSVFDKSIDEKKQTLQTTQLTLAAMEPKDAMEGLLVSRMLAMHDQGMVFLNKAAIATQDQMCDLYVNMATKLFRLFNETLDMLLRYRRKGEQRVIVQHVNVNDGGKAIVGTVVSS